MRRKIICLLLAFCLMLSLTACRKTDNNTGNSAGDNTGEQSSDNSTNNSTNTGDTANTDGSITDNTVYKAKKAARSYSRDMKNDFDRMMDNARVHDGDGILTDGENPTHETLR